MLVYGLPNGVAVAGGYVLINLLLGNFVEPMLMGRRFGLSTLVVVLSVLFWGWLWGPVGMLLAVPLTMMLKVVLDNSRRVPVDRRGDQQGAAGGGGGPDHQGPGRPPIPGEEGGEAAEAAEGA
jgi:predicted PurR-regulated permease PerM